MLKVYNTLTRQKEDFHPLNDGVVNMYVCGPTVYNYIHIGNARSAIAFDTIRRYFEFSGYQVNYVSNFTDVDDKMIKAAHEQGITVPELADKYIAAFMEDTTAVNIEPATKHPRATENIPEIITFVSDLIDKGYAYAVAGDVYYRARKFKHYGELSDQSIDDLEVGASQHVDEAEFNKKEDPIDFALWKAAKPGEISWDSPWGRDDPVGTSSARLCQPSISVILLIFMAGDKILRFHITKTKLPKAKLKRERHLPAIGCTMAL